MIRKAFNLVVLFSVSILVYSLMNYIFEHVPAANCSSEKDLKKKVIAGKVLDKYIDSSQHCYPTIEVSRPFRKLIIFGYDKSNIYSILEIGDSLVKPGGSLNFTLYRDGFDTLIVVDYQCED